MSNRARIREESVKLNPIDDAMFVLMAFDVGFCREILRAIMNDSQLEILGEPTPQYHLPNPMGRKVTLDAVCRLKDGRVVGVEVQKDREADPQRRVRYEESLLTTHLTNPNTKFKDLQDIVFVYISGFDPFGLNRSVYYIDRVIRGLGEVINNGFEEIYVNAAVRDGTDISELMRVFTEDATYSEKFPRTSEIKRQLKLTKEGRQRMTAELEKIMIEEREQEIEVCSATETVGGNSYELYGTVLRKQKDTG